MSDPTEYIIILTVSIALSTLLYLFLRHKTRIRSMFLYVDNPAVALIAFITGSFSYRVLTAPLWLVLFVILPVVVTLLAFSLTMIRFWRIPRREIKAAPGQIMSPADGKVIYIRSIEKGELPVSIKGKVHSRLEEITKTSLLDNAGWQIGINMTPFDVHKNCAPVSGKIILSRHFPGKFISLKDAMSQTDNERNTWVIQNETLTVGVVQIASRLVRRIDTYIKQGETVTQGEWLGMIRFGSQVDIILPAHCRILVSTGQQIFAAKTIVAECHEDPD
jgi:phosphatidylserine decarboxylase